MTDKIKTGSRKNKENVLKNQGVQYLPRQKIEELSREGIDSWDKAARIIKLDPDIQKSVPWSYAIDPRNGELIIYAPSRKKRVKNKGLKLSTTCIICDGIDRLPNIMRKNLPDSVTPDGKQALTFIIENLYPFLNPSGTPGINSETDLQGGLFLHLTSNIHTDIEEMSCHDNKVCLDLLADFEKMLLHTGTTFPRLQNRSNHFGHVQIIKNKGQIAGGSMAHGHYQIAYMSKLPRKIKDDMAFADKEGRSFTKYIKEENPVNLRLCDYNNIMAVVPEQCMKRPLEVIILPKNTNKYNLHELEGYERLGVARVLRDIIKSLSIIMPEELNKEFAYNLEFHSGSGGFYIEILPFTQVYGGYEKMSIYICESTPQQSADLYKKTLAKMRRK